MGLLLIHTANLVVSVNVQSSLCSDEYILPKIAERDLRRFANLRNSSAVLGAQIPLSRVTLYTYK